MNNLMGQARQFIAEHGISITSDTAHALRAFAAKAIEAGLAKDTKDSLSKQLDVLGETLLAVYEKSKDAQLRELARHALKTMGADPACPDCHGTGQVHGFAQDDYCRLCSQNVLMRTGYLPFLRQK